MKKTHNTAHMPFFFMVGIECTQIVDVRPDLNINMRELDEFEIMQHYSRWREDLDLIASLRTENAQVTRVRWCIPWFRVETAPGVYDFSWTDQVIAYAQELGIELIPDLVHYGTPRWMPQAFLDPTYPERVASFATVCAARYKGQIHHWTPFNEPAVTALFCGRRGEWPPYLSSEEGYVRILMAIAIGMQKSVAAIRAIDPTATIWAAEAVHNYHPLNEEARPAAQAALHRDLVSWDLVHGRVNEAHACFAWLSQNGATMEQFAELQANAVTLDILGLNFYPWGSETYEMKDGVIHQFWDWNGRHTQELLRETYAYTGAVLYITETSAHGGGGPKSQSMIDNAGDFRIRWMDESIEAVAAARQEGIPVLGYTQFPLFTMVDWKYRMEEGTAQDFFVHFGMIEVDGEDFSRRWTPVADRFLHHMRTFERPVPVSDSVAQPVEA